MPVLRFERRGRVALLTLDRASRLNAIGSDTVAELHSHLDLIEAESDLRAIVITGEGRAFSAGADISELDTLRSGADFARFVKGLTDAYDRLANSSVPSIAALNGMAFGGGFELALACDLRIAVPGVRLGVPEVQLGLLPAAGGSQRLARLVGLGRALDIALSGEHVKAEEALRYALSLPVTTVITGAESRNVLRKSLRLATHFKPFHAGEMDELRHRARPVAGDGRFERYKTTLEFDGSAGLAAHGYGLSPKGPKSR